MLFLQEPFFFLLYCARDCYKQDCYEQTMIFFSYFKKSTAIPGQNMLRIQGERVMIQEMPLLEM